MDKHSNFESSIGPCDNDSWHGDEHLIPDATEADPDHQREEDQQAEIWDAIENGDLGLLAAMMGPK